MFSAGGLLHTRSLNIIIFICAYVDRHKNQETPVNHITALVEMVKYIQLYWHTKLSS